MLFRCFLLLFCLTAIGAQKGGRQASASEANPSVQRSPSRALAQRKLPQPSEPIQQVQEPDRDPDEDKTVVSGVRPSRPLPRPRPQPQPQPQPTEAEGHEPAPEPYSFSYQVDDPETGAASSREETQDANGEITGYYHIKDKDGRTRRVDYTAGKDGFKATIKSNEEGLNARAPADVNIELSASPSEARPSYAPNNRPTGAESSIKNFGKPPNQRFYQRLLAPPTPIPAPSDPQPLEQTPEKPEEAQISQRYEDPAQITQQRNVDDEVPFESTPVKSRPPVPPARVIQPVQPVPQPIVYDTPRVRPVGTYTPQLSQTYREQGSVSLESAPISQQPITQVKEDLPNSIQEVQESVKPSAPVISAPPQAPIAPVRPVGTVTPQFSQYFHSGAPAAVATVQKPIEEQVVEPLSPPTNIIVQNSEHRVPISQEQLLNFLHPLQTPYQTPLQTVTIDQIPQQINIHPHLNAEVQRQIPLYRTYETPSVTYVPQPPRPVSPPAQEVITQERVAEEPEQPSNDNRYRSESKILESSPPAPAPQQPQQHVLPVIRQHFRYQPLLPVWAQQQTIQAQPQPLPSPPQPLPARPLPAPPRAQPSAPQTQQKFFDEPQVYEPASQQTYEPLVQEAEDPAEESRAAPPKETVCECAKQAESRRDPVKGSASEAAPVKGGERLSPPARNYIPQAFRSR